MVPSLWDRLLHPVHRRDNLIPATTLIQTLPSQTTALPEQVGQILELTWHRPGQKNLTGWHIGQATGPVGQATGEDVSGPRQQNLGCGLSVRRRCSFLQDGDLSLRKE